MPSRPTPSILDVEREYQIDSPEEREQRFRQVFDDGPVGIVLVGTDFRFLAMNRAFCDMLGYDVSELLNRSFPDVTHPHDVDDNREAARQLFAGETPAVRIRIALSARTPGMVELTVADDGHGIPEGLEMDQLETLGLQLVHNLAKQLGGQIDLFRDPGTRFVISFPLPEVSTTL